MRRSVVQLWGQTCGSSPSGDAAGVIGLEQLRGPGDTDGADGRILLHTYFLKGKLLQFYQSDVILVAGGVVSAEVSGYNDFFKKCFSCWMDGWMDRWTDTWGGCRCHEHERCRWCSELLTSSTEKTLSGMHVDCTC